MCANSRNRNLCDQVYADFRRTSIAPNSYTFPALFKVCGRNVKALYYYFGEMVNCPTGCEISEKFILDRLRTGLGNDAASALFAQRDAELRACHQRFVMFSNGPTSGKNWKTAGHTTRYTAGRHTVGHTTTQKQVPRGGPSSMSPNRPSSNRPRAPCRFWDGRRESCSKGSTCQFLHAAK